jgi:hypothetical protein
MKNASLLACGAVVLAANGLALLHAARNRSGQPDAEITLTERDVSFLRNEDDSGVTLLLNIRGLPNFRPYGRPLPAQDWVDRARLISLGFDCSVEPGEKRAREFYERQVPRSAFMAIEAQPDGLAAIDAAADAGELRVRHPDRNAVVIQPAVIRIQFRDDGKQPRIAGYFDSVYRPIHIPQPFSETLRGLRGAHPAYRVNLKFGSLLDPWVTGVANWN